jgi:carboxymethylenebutenolidase
LLIHLDELEASFAPEGGRALEAKLRDGKVSFESYWYNAGHAFFNENGPNYNAACAQQAWQRTTEFFAKHLK